MQDYSQVIKGCLRHKSKAQRQLFEEFEGLVMGICLRYCSSRMEAEDMFQESFIRIFDKLSTLKDHQALPAWIKQTAIRTAINGYRKDVKHRSHLDVEAADNDPTPELSALDLLSNEEIVNLINQLAEPYRMVFNLYVIDGYKHWEIGEMLDIAENTSKSQLARARQQLQAKLQALGITRYERSL
ncbi:MAG TPA: RNA polymerase subunit sigma-24 [Cytophagales bacterium]|nr:RNA polymerase subunit sigma-24 [Cytophagales bacterium]HAA21943.1 RNA polymerase subunit sigma-24 [Cytophagales bacterium]HAP61361.1 RNA polymerase subunit sigma-24 [Cytophagales bacterium]